MKKNKINLLLLLVLILLISLVHGQNREIEKIDSLLCVVKLKQKGLNDERIFLQKNEDSLLRVKQILIDSKYFGEIFICQTSTYIYPNPVKNFVDGYIIKRHQKLKVLDRLGEFYRVYHNGNIGYTKPEMYKAEAEAILENKKRDSLLRIEIEKEDLRLAQLEIEKKRDLKENQLRLEKQRKKRKEEIRKQIEIRLKALTSKYGSEIAHKIIVKEIWIGMSSEMAIESRGKPIDINRTVTQYGVREQWVYGDISNRIYLYFVNSILESWQD